MVYGTHVELKSDEFFPVKGYQLLGQRTPDQMVMAPGMNDCRPTRCDIPSCLLWGMMPMLTMQHAQPCGHCPLFAGMATFKLHLLNLPVASESQIKKKFADIVEAKTDPSMLDTVKEYLFGKQVGSLDEVSAPANEGLHLQMHVAV